VAGWRPHLGLQEREIQLTLDSISDYRVYTENVANPKQQTSPQLLKIGEVAARSGLGVEALRFYETRGLLQPVTRTEAGYRLYDAAVFERLDFIRKAQAIGFNLDEISRIITEARVGLPCAEVRRLAMEKLADLDRRLAELKRYRRELKETVDAWERVGQEEGVICGLIEGLKPAAADAPKTRRPTLARSGSGGRHRERRA
jgi:DNA-binding transcriptional MerR regulator